MAGSEAGMRVAAKHRNGKVGEDVAGKSKPHAVRPSPFVLRRRVTYRVYTAYMFACCAFRRHGGRAKPVSAEVLP